MPSKVASAATVLLLVGVGAIGPDPARAETCAPASDSRTLAAIAAVESGHDPFAVHDNPPFERSYHPASQADAVALAERLIQAGHHPDLGLMQINSRNLGWLGLSIAQAFDPAASRDAGCRVLQAALRRALSAYNTGNEQAGFANGYVDRIVRARIAIPDLIPTGAERQHAPAAPPPRPSADPAAASVFARPGVGREIIAAAH